MFQQYKTGYTNGRQNTWQLDGSYDFGMFKLFGQYGQVKDTGAAVPFKDKIWQIGGSVPMGAGALLASYGQQKHDLTTVAEKDTNNTFSLGYDYNLSKRTDVYVNYMYDRAKSSVISLDNANTVAVGIRHRF
ncbi:outer membrane porin protein precursor [mine drainage metagenome]|uniref:Outer membrane porin protein n=1 Tax=mine drainage metagenome TaxID=410659 RepID=A0A1J5PFL1_9ZZZZ